MDSSTLDKLIGALISLVSVLVTFILTSLNQRDKDIRDRKWLLEDRERDKHQTLLAVRLAECKEYINLEFDIAANLLNYETEIVLGADVNEFVNETNYKEMNLMLGHAIKQTASVLSLGDEELMKLTNSMLKINEKEIHEYYDLSIKARDKVSIDTASEIDRISKFQKQVAEIRISFIKRVDELSGLKV